MTPCRFLLVEDSPSDVLLIRRALRKLGLEEPLVVLGDGEAAVAYLEGRGEYAARERHPLPTVLLLDLKLPRRSGFEVLSWVRAQPGLKRLPVVVLTSSRELEDVDRAYELGASSYLVKPVSLAEFTDMLASLRRYWDLNERPRLAAGERVPP